MMLGWLMNLRIRIYLLTWLEAKSTFEIMFLFFIFFLLMILTATSMFVMLCRATSIVPSVTFDFAESPLPDGFAQNVVPDDRVVPHIN